MRIEASGLDAAIKRLERLKNDMDTRMKTMITRLGEEGIQVADARYMVAQYDGPSQVAVQPNVVWVSATEAYITAYGDKILFIEFGSGQAYEDHPRQDLVLPHGAYGAGRGQIGRYPKGWVYEGPIGHNPTPYAHHPRVVHRDGTFGPPQMNKVRTKGNPPARAMYEAGRKMHELVSEIAKEVYGAR